MSYDSNWNLIEDYTFSGSSLNGSIWTVYSGGQWNGSLTTVSGGNVNLMTDGTSDAGIKSNSSWTYGRWEITAVVDIDPEGDSGNTGPAILLWPEDQAWPLEVEVDITEQRDGSRTSSQTTIHYGQSNTAIYLPAVTEVNGISFSGATSHVYACEWMPLGLTFWIDGYQTDQLTGPAAAIPQTPHFLGMQFGLNNYGSSASSGIGLHISEVKVFDSSGYSAVELPRRFVQQNSQRFRFI